MISACPECHAELKVRQELLGRKVRCPKCQAQFELSSVRMTTDKSTSLAAMTIEQVNVSEATHAASASSISVSSATRTSQQRKAEKSLGKLGRFEIKQVLGQGAFGRVFRAYDPVLDRYVALKVPTFGSGEEQKVRRFLGEAKAAAGLRHPNIVPVYECGEADGKQFIAAQFVAGQTLASRMKSGPVPFHVAVEWCRAIADALAYAHGEGIVHRDIKPDNVMLDAKEAPQIMDFGLAKRTSEDSSMTMDGTILGTPAYMSPEQATGRQALIGPASDQYSLGAVLYELLTGKKPFEGTPHAVIAKVISHEPEAPRKLNPQIPPDLEAICLKAMQKEANARYASAADFAADLNRWLRGEAVKARAVTPVERLVRLCKRNPLVAGLTVALFVALALGTVVSAMFAAQASRRATLAQKEAQRADAEAKRADAQATAAESASEQAQRESQAARAAETRASQALRAARQREYFASMLLVRSEWDKSNLGRVTQLLQNQIPAEGEEDYRHFEWHYWWNRAHSRLTIRPGLPLTNIGSLPALSSDGELIAYGNRSQMSVYDCRTGKIRALAFGESVTSGNYSLTFAISDDRKWLVAATPGPVVKRESDPNSYSFSSVSGAQLWNLETGERAAHFPIEAMRIIAFAFSPDGKQAALAIHSRDNPPKNVVQLWNLDGTKVWEREESGASIGLHFDPAGTQLIQVMTDGIAWYDCQENKLVRKIRPASLRPTHSRLHAPTQLLVCGSYDGPIYLFHSGSGADRGRLNGHNGYITAIAVSPDGQKLASAGNDNTVRIWGLGARSEIDVKPLRQVRALAVAANSVRALSWGRTHSLVDIDLSDVAAPPPTKGTFHGFSKDGSRAMIGNSVVDLRTNKELFSAKYLLKDCLLNADGTRLFMASAEKPGAVDIVNVDTGQLLARCTRENSKLRPTVLCRGESRLITIDASLGETNAWSVTTGEHEETLEIPKVLGMSHDERLIAFAEGRDIIIRDVASGADLLRATREGNFLYALSPKWDAVAVTRPEGEVAIYDVASGAERALLQGHADRIESLDFSSDGKRIVTGSFDMTARVWDAETGYELLSLPAGIASSSTRVCFRSDDRLLAVWAASPYSQTTFYEALPPPRANFVVLDQARTGSELGLDGAGSQSPSGQPLRYQWMINDAPVSTEARWTYRFPAAGDYRIALIVSAGRLSDTLTHQVRVLPNSAELGTEEEADEWSFVPAGNLAVTFELKGTGATVGKSHIIAKYDPYHGFLAELLYPQSKSMGVSLDGKSRLLFSMKAHTQSGIGWQNFNPTITLYESAEKRLRLTPRMNLLHNSKLDDETTPWQHFAVPLAGDEQWQSEGQIDTFNWLTIGVDSWEHLPLQVWLDGLFLE